MRSIDFTEKAKSDIDLFKKSGNKLVLKKANTLIQEICKTPFTGTGKPEPLKHHLSGLWSRRINKEHRIIYSASEELVIIHSLRGHYD